MSTVDGVRPRIVAAAEILLVAGLVVLAVWCWRQGTETVRFTVQGSDPPLDAHRYLGNWIGGAVVSCVAGGFLLLDALRRLFRAPRGAGGRAGTPGYGTPTVR